MHPPPSNIMDDPTGIDFDVADIFVDKRSSIFTISLFSFTVHPKRRAHV